MAVKFNIITKVESLSGYIFVITEKAPKKFRTDISSQLRIKAMLIQDNIVRANHYAIDKGNATPHSIKERQHFQEEVLINLKVLDSFLSLAHSVNAITTKQLAYATKLSQELADMVVSWVSSDKKRIVA